MSALVFGYEVFHPDVEVPARFYVDVLGFTRGDGDGHYLTVHRDALTVGCSRLPGADADPSPRRPPAGSEVVLRVEDVDAEHARVVASGWPLADEMRERPWGARDFRLFDPTGQYVRVTSR